MRGSLWAAAAAVLGLVGGGLLAQTETASLSVVVTDPSRAPAAGAKVTLESKATSARREALTGTDGRCLFPLVAPGLYELTVEAPGFKQFRDGAVRVQVAQAAQIAVRLELGEVAETVQVEGTASLVVAESVAQGAVVTEEKIMSLPLDGRQFISLALLAPGANRGGRTVQQNSVRLNQTGGLSVSGGRTNNNAFLLDGAANTDPDYNALNYSPVIDAIAEFQVQTAQFSARYGRASGAQINVVSKAGDNQWRGSAWEFLRNRVFDARPFNLIESRLPKYQRNQYGATAGGPIRRNRVFAFGAWEGLRIRQAGAGLTTVTVPTALERRGDFSQTRGGIYDPNTLAGGVRQPFPNWHIPTSRQSPLTAAAMNAMPAPSIGEAQYANAAGILAQDADNYSLRVDYVPSGRLTFFSRYSVWNESNRIPDVVPNRDRVGESRPQNVVAGSTQVAGANLVNEVRLGFNRLRFQDGLPEPLFSVGGTQRTLPRFVVAGYPTMGGAGGFTGTTGGGAVLVRNNTYQVYDNLSWVRGRHSLSFGGEMLWLEYNRHESANVTGQYQFSAGFTSRTASNDGTGNILASMLLGLPQQGSRSVGPSRIDARQQAFSAYVQDDIRLSPRLMLNAGLRYELAPPYYDHRQQMGSIDYRGAPTPQEIFAEGRLGFYRATFFICGQAGYPKGCAYTDKNNLSPRLGLAWTATPKTVVRAGAGIFYAATDANPLFRLAAVLPGNIAQTLSSNSFIPQFSNFDIFGPATVGSGAIQQAGLDLFQRTSYSAQWTLTIQRELGRDMVVETGYLTTLGLKLEQNVQPNNAQPGPGSVDARRPYGRLQFANGTKFPDYVSVVADSVPVTFINYLPHAAQSNYHALFVRFEKRFARGLSWLSSWNFSKAITNAPQFRNAGGANGAENSPPQDSFCLRCERGLASFDLRQRWVHTMVWETPFGKGRRHLADGIAAHVLGGWTLSGIFSAQTGFPFTVNLAGDTAGIGGGTGAILIRPNQVPGKDWRLSGAQRSTARYFDTSAFVLPPALAFGTVGRNSVIGPGMANLDFMAARGVRLGERLQVQFRAEFFNLFNKPNYDIVGRIINNVQFGRVQSQLPPRQIQFGAKVQF